MFWRTFKMSRSDEITLKIQTLFKSLEQVIKTEDDELKKKMPKELEGVDDIIDAVNEYEKKLAKILKAQRKHFTKGINDKVAKAISLKGLFKFVTETLFSSDPTAEAVKKMTEDFLNKTVKNMTTFTMDIIDKDISFNTFSDRTTEWISSWSEELGDLMQLTSHNAVERVLDNALKEGKSIQKVVEELEVLPQFDRLRARRTAITEILTANSVSQLEAYRQSPSVKKKRWTHSGTRRIDPREYHMNTLDGQEIDVNEDFDVDGQPAQHPRDTRLSASERVECHCVLQPVVDSDILGLSKEEKEKIREEALPELKTRNSTPKPRNKK
jgi:hypothetical protein